MHCCKSISRPETRLESVYVMTIYKAKGKEFDEVIVYEGRYQHRMVDARESADRIAQARRNLRVAVTRETEGDHPDPQRRPLHSVVSRAVLGSSRRSLLDARGKKPRPLYGRLFNP